MGVGVCLEQIGDFVGAEKICRWAIKLLETSYELSECRKSYPGRRTLWFLWPPCSTARSTARRTLSKPTKKPSGYTGRLGDRAQAARASDEARWPALEDGKP